MPTKMDVSMGTTIYGNTRIEDIMREYDANIMGIYTECNGHRKAGHGRTQ